MKIIRLTDAPSYAAPKHYDMRSLRLQGHDVSDSAFAWVGLSYFLPQGGAQMDIGAFEKIYVMIAGSITLQSADGTRHVLEPLDSCHIPAGEARSILNETNTVATLLVLAPYA